MGYEVREQYGVVTVNDTATKDQPKMIRFITPNYDLLFKLPDKDYVQVTFEDGETRAYQCTYLDEYHMLVGSEAYHICEFAEYMEHIKAKYAPSPDRHVIWSDMHLDLEEWRADLMEEYPEMDDIDLFNKMVDINAGYLDDERMNLNQPIGGTLLVIADLGLWDGHHSGYREVPNAKLKDCLVYRYDSAEWYVTRDGEFCGAQGHHDGTNHYVYRKVKDGVSEDALADLELKLYNGEATQKDIDAVTEKLGQKVAEVYGFGLPTKILDGPKKKQPAKTDRSER